MKILYESSIPFGQEYFSELGNAQSFSVGKLKEQNLGDVECLVVRSTSTIDLSVIARAPALKQVVTATSGTDHFDVVALDKHNIAWGASAGCNAIAVAEYVLSALFKAHCAKKIDLSNTRVGIVGAGHVGTALSKILDALSIRYLLCDPILAAKNSDGRKYVDMSTILTCEVITLHVPFVKGGLYSTNKLIDKHALNVLTNKQLLINACRGEVIDEAALKSRLAEPDAPTVVLDVWLNEPNIDTHLLDQVWLATPHIAGHTVEGKVRGTQMAYDQLCKNSGKTPSLSIEQFLSIPEPLKFANNSLDDSVNNYNEISNLIFSVYDIEDDDRIFRQGMAKSPSFSSMRKDYRVRREIAAFRVKTDSKLSDKQTTVLQELGFQLNNAG